MLTNTAKKKLLKNDVHNILSIKIHVTLLLVLMTLHYAKRRSW